MALGDGIRRNVAEISQEERNRLRDALIKLNQIFYPGSITDGPPYGGVSYWFKQDEIHQATHVHGGPAFLTWHRELCNRFEQLLRSVDPDLSLHYWDWTTDPTQSPDGKGGFVNLFMPAFMGASIGIAGEPWLTARFYDPNANPSRGPAFSDPAHLNPYAPPLSMDRAVQGGIPNLGVSDAQIISAPDYQSMRNDIAGLEAAHNNAHGYIGGTLGDAHTSFRDPFVYLLHSNVDRLFALWQLQDPAKRLDPEQVYGAESNSQAQGRDVGILTPMEPWWGLGAPGIEAGVVATRPWAPPENEQLLHVNQKNSKDPTVVTPPLYDTSPVGAGDHFYSISADAATNPVDYQSEGVACSVFSSPTTLALYRLLNPNNGDHFYTTSLAERDNAIAAFGYRSEDIACYAYDSQVPGTTPLYRLLNPTIGHHFYTTSAAERDNAVGNLGYQSEGIACYVYGSQAPGITPLYRLLNPGNGDHFYTTSAAERDNAVASFGYQSEGIACYVLGSAVTVPLYRLLNASDGDHFYTASLAERDNAVASFGYQSEDIACYVYGSQAPGTTPLYRLLKVKAEAAGA
jgi:hypothetical protein